MDPVFGAILSDLTAGYFMKYYSSHGQIIHNNTKSIHTLIVPVPAWPADQLDECLSVCVIGETNKWQGVSNKSRKYLLELKNI